jgi:hypothetical protein
MVASTSLARCIVCVPDYEFGDGRLQFALLT